MQKYKTKLLLLGVSCIAIIGNTYAQSTGNNLFPPGNKFLGYSNNLTNPLLFKSNNADKMMMSGNVTNSINGGFPLNRHGFLG